jgi:hypothetical protein
MGQHERQKGTPTNHNARRKQHWIYIACSRYSETEGDDIHRLNRYIGANVTGKNPFSSESTPCSMNLSCRVRWNVKKRLIFIF